MTLNGPNDDIFFSIKYWKGIEEVWKFFIEIVWQP